MTEQKKGILDQLLEEAMAKGAKDAQAEDFAVNVSDAEGNRIEGIPVSKLGRSFLEKFGITGSSEEGGGDGSSSAEGQTGGAAGGVKNLFKGGARPAGGTGTKAG